MDNAIQAINEFVENSCGWGYELQGELSLVDYEYDMPGWTNRRQVPKPPTVLPGLGVLEYVEGYEGAEEGGSDAHQILSLTAEDGTKRFFRKQGYYASHYGTDWDGDLYEVVPKEVIVTQYARK